MKTYRQIFQHPNLTKKLEEGFVDPPVWASRRKYAPVEGNYLSLWEDEETGLVTADPKKFEAWMTSLKIGLTF